jgi:hypothetical protein
MTESSISIKELFDITITMNDVSKFIDLSRYYNIIDKLQDLDIQIESYNDYLANADVVWAYLQKVISKEEFELIYTKRDLIDQFVSRTFQESLT